MVELILVFNRLTKVEFVRLNSMCSKNEFLIIFEKGSVSLFAMQFISNNFDKMKLNTQTFDTESNDTWRYRSFSHVLDTNNYTKMNIQEK